MSVTRVDASRSVVWLWIRHEGERVHRGQLRGQVLVSRSSTTPYGTGPNYAITPQTCRPPFQTCARLDVLLWMTVKQER